MADTFNRPFVGIFTGFVVYALVAARIVDVPEVTDPLLLRAFLVLVGGYSERVLGGAVAQAESILSSRASAAEHPASQSGGAAGSHASGEPGKGPPGGS